MFARLRQTPNRLQVSLVEGRRVDGKVRHRHVAMLGSIPGPWEIADRITFWLELHQRLGRLSNQISAADLHKVMVAIHERIPMAMSDEQRRLQRENAEHDLAVSSSLHAINEGTLGGEEVSGLGQGGVAWGPVARRRNDRCRHRTLSLWLR
jgi:hypothetical protein